MASGKKVQISGCYSLAAVENLNISPKVFANSPFERFSEAHYGALFSIKNYEDQLEIESYEAGQHKIRKFTLNTEYEEDVNWKILPTMVNDKTLKLTWISSTGTIQTATYEFFDDEAMRVTFNRTNDSESDHVD